MQIPQNQISYKKEIGHSDGAKVFEIGTIGGLHLIIMAKGSEYTTAGAGPHRGIARFIAKKKHPGMQFTALEKSEDADPSTFQDLLPAYEALTDKFNA